MMNEDILALRQPSVELSVNDHGLAVSMTDDVSDNNINEDSDEDCNAATFSVTADATFSIGEDDASSEKNTSNTEHRLHKIESNTSNEFLKNSRRLVSWRTRKQTTTDKIFGDCLRKLENGEKVEMEAVDSMLKATIQEQERVQQSRGKGWKKAGYWITTFAHNISILLSSMSSIVSVVKGVDDQFGGAVYGVLSVLLMVAYNKRRKESLIDSGLVHIHKSIPRLEAFKEIYKIQSLVTDVYQEIITFIRFACNYYQRSGIFRVLSAIYDGPRVTLERILRSVSHNEALVLKEVNVQLNQRVKMIQEAAEGQKRDLANIRVENLQLKKLVKESVRKQDISLTRDNTQDKLDDMIRLEKLSKVLGVDGHVERELLTSTGRNQRRWKYSKELSLETRKQILRPISENMLCADPEFCVWRERETTSLFLLSGANHRYIETQTKSSWLSLAAVHLLEMLSSQSPKPWTFYVEFESGNASRLDLAMASLIYQLASTSPLLTRTRPFIKLAGSAATGGDDQDELDKFDNRIEFLQEVLETLQSPSPVYIILDRIDHCGPDANEVLGSFCALLKKVADRNKSLVLKVLVINNSTYSHSPDSENLSEKKIAQWQRKLGPDRLIYHLDWKQPELRQASDMY